MHRLLCALAVASSASSPLVAQCGTQWLPGDGSGGTNNGVTAAIRWDPDGPGPGGERLVIAGYFQMVGAVPTNSIAVFDPVSGLWSPFGSGMNGPVQALLAMPNGDLLAGGQFTVAGGTNTGAIARWNGSTWSPIGAGLPVSSSQYGVRALALLPNGDVVAGGNFFPAGGPMSIARWNGATWSPLGGGITGISNSTVHALCVSSNGDLVAGGLFTMIGGVPVANIARWNGLAWSPLGTGTDATVQALCELPNGTLIAGGIFDHAGGAPAPRIASWNGASWSALGSGMAGAPFGGGVFAMTLRGTDLIAGGVFPNAGGVAVNHIARWDGSSWWPLGSGVSSTNSGVYSLVTLPGGDLVAGGGFTTAGTTPARNLARWNGTTWSAFAVGTDGHLMAMAPLPNDLVVGGQFTTIGGVPANNIARRSGGTWQALGSGTDALVTCVAALPNGDIVAGGQFGSAGGTPTNRIARWNGTTWLPLGAGVGGAYQPEVWSLAVESNGDLIAGGTFTTAGGAPANRIARWNGTAWLALGAGVADGSSPYVTTSALAFLPNGDLIAGGDFTSAGGAPANRLARWNGASWSPLGSGAIVPFSTYSARIRSLLAMPNGDVVAAGDYSAVIGDGILLQRWNGSTWSSLATGLAIGPNPRAGGLALLPNGDIAAGLSRVGLPGGPIATSLARWNGSAWSVLGSNLDHGITSLVMQKDGTLAVGGAFTAISSVVSVGFARLTSTCPAAVATLGTGCTGSAGPNTLVADLAWTGGTFRSLASGLTPSGLAASVYGFTALALPMPTVHPLGQAGCTLWVDDDISLSFVRGNGTVASELAIPSQAALVGGVFHHQVVPAEIDPSGNLQALTSTNALTLTIGVF